jgi:hypothetical protein
VGVNEGHAQDADCCGDAGASGLAIIVTGCAASLEGYPDPPTDPEGDLKQLAIYASPDAIATDPADIFARRKNAADFVRSLAKAGKPSDIDRLATVFGTGPPALPGILVEIDKAKDKTAVDAVSKQIQSAFPDKEF